MFYLLRIRIVKRREAVLGFLGLSDKGAREAYVVGEFQKPGPRDSTEQSMFRGL